MKNIYHNIKHINNLFYFFCFVFVEHCWLYNAIIIHCWRCPNVPISGGVLVGSSRDINIPVTEMPVTFSAGARGPTARIADSSLCIVDWTRLGRTVT